MSSSHDHNHLNRVKDFAFELQREHGGDREVLAAAALLHDLGRADEERAHGQDSIEASLEEADKVLDDLSEDRLSGEQRQKVLAAIKEHDQPEITPSTVEGRILKDADFLAGFGAWGVLRIAMWSGESNRSMATLLDRIREGMTERSKNLEFPESRVFARKEMRFIRLFLSLLDEPAKIPSVREDGLYIVLEGISGSGKDTQAELLCEAFEQRGRKTLQVGEPNSFYETCSLAYKKNYDESMPEGARKWLFVADRQQLMEKKVRPALENGEVVVSARNFISTLVHQCETDVDEATLAFVHQFVPTPDLVLLMDVDAKTALQRIADRGKERGRYETDEHLRDHRERYVDLCKRHFDDDLIQVVDASQTVEEVEKEIWQSVSALAELD